MKILIINGPNLNLLGKRDTKAYGTFTLADLEATLRNLFPEISFSFFQSNIEGEIIDRIQSLMDGSHDALIINPGGFSHTSVAIRDALEPLKKPKVEVHISNIHGREEFRKESITGAVTDGIITGFGENSYILGVEAVKLLSVS